MSDAEASNKTANVPQWKREEVEELADFVDSYDAVGVVDLTGIPSRQLQDMRRELHGQAALRMSRNTLTVRALEEAGGSLADLAEEMTGHVGLIGTNDNPFGLYQQLEASKTSAPISAGEVAPNEIVIPEGDTGVDPGPFVGELQQAGADARIQEGSIQVLSDSVVAEPGDEVDADLAGVLGELGIEPKEVGLDLRAVVADGVVFEPEDLAIDIDEYRADVEAAAAGARNLALNAAIPTAKTVGSLLGKAAGEAKSVGVSAAIADEELVPDLVAEADAQVRALAAEIDDEEALPEELRGVEPAADPEPADDEDEEEQEQTDDDPEPETDDAEEDDEDDGAAGLGDMFGD